jgi:transposase
VAFEAGRDGFWLARWLRAHGIVRGLVEITLRNKLQRK